MIIKKILIVKPKVIINSLITHYVYPKIYNAKHAHHICYNLVDDKNLRGGCVAEGMLIYEAEEQEIKRLLEEDGVEELTYNEAKIKGKKWNPKTTIDTPMGKVKKKAFDIEDWIKDKNEISNKKLK